MEAGGHQEGRGGLLREPVWSEQDTDNPLGLPGPFPHTSGLQGGAPGTELGLDSIRRPSNHSEWSGSLVAAGQGYGGTVEGSGGRSQGRESISGRWGTTKNIKNQWGFYLGEGRVSEGE